MNGEVTKLRTLDLGAGMVVHGQELAINRVKELLVLADSCIKEPGDDVSAAVRRALAPLHDNGDRLAKIRRALDEPDGTLAFIKAKDGTIEVRVGFEADDIREYAASEGHASVEEAIDRFLS